MHFTDSQFCDIDHEFEQVCNLLSLKPREASMNLSRVAAIATIAFTINLSQATAQQEDSAINASLLACKEIADPMQRLACMDAATDAMANAVIEQKANRVAQEEKARDQFGLAEKPTKEQEPVQVVQETEDEFGSEAVPETKKKREERKLKSITARITDIRANPYGSVTLTLENGQVWRQLDSDGKRLNIRKSNDKTYTAEVKRGAVGGYRLKVVELRKTVRVRRIK